MQKAWTNRRRLGLRALGVALAGWIVAAAVLGRAPTPALAQYEPNPVDPEDDEYSGTLFRSGGGRSSSASNRRSYDVRNAAPQYIRDIPNAEKYRYSSDAWRQPLPPPRGVYAQPADGRSPSAVRPFRAIDESIAGNMKVRLGGDDEEKGFAPSFDIKGGFLTLFGQGPNERAAESYYDEGVELYRQKRYSRAADKFGWAEFRAPESPLKEKALYLEAESHFFAESYAEAQEAYLALLIRYEHSPYRDRIVRRLFDIARYWEYLDAEVNSLSFHIGDGRQPWLDTFGAAMRTYENIWTQDPLGDLADDSLMAAGTGYLRRRRFDEAAMNFEFLRREHPDSEHLVNAYRFEIFTRSKMYQGPAYDGSELKDCEKLIDQALVQFGAELGEDRQKLIQAKNKVSEELALRDWTVAQYYERKQRYGAARFYYEAILKEHPNTLTASKARSRYAEIRELPAEPQQFAWWLRDSDSSTTRR